MVMEGRYIGSQFRQTLKQAGYTFVKSLGDGLIILADEDGKYELFAENDHHSGWTIEVRGVGYEFVSDYSPVTKSRVRAVIHGSGKSGDTRIKKIKKVKYKGRTYHVMRMVKSK